jgi:hypothetical protein
VASPSDPASGYPGRRYFRHVWRHRTTGLRQLCVTVADQLHQPAGQELPDLTNWPGHRLRASSAWCTYFPAVSGSGNASSQPVSLAIEKVYS